jgi:hypothetical protein
MGFSVRVVGDPSLAEVDPQYVLNELTAAPWTYTGVAFTDMKNTRDGGAFLLCPVRGLLAINGPGGTPVRNAPAETLAYSVNFGGSDYGVSARKNMDSVWVGVAVTGTPPTTIGNVTLQSDEDKQYTHPLRYTKPLSRAMAGRGFSGRTIRIQYEWTTSLQFAIDMVEPSLATGSNRRMP